MGHRRASATCAAIMAAVVLPTLAAAQGRGGGEDPAVTLSFAVTGPASHPMAEYARVFIEEASKRSAGSIDIQPTWEASGGAATGYEEGVAKQLVAGTADLA